MVWVFLNGFINCGLLCHWYAKRDYIKDEKGRTWSIHQCNRKYSRSQWPHGLRRRSSAVRLLRLWVRIPPGAWMSVCCECCVLSGRGRCEGLITCPEESYRLWCVVVCDLETSWMRWLWPTGGCCAKKKEEMGNTKTKKVCKSGETTWLGDLAVEGDYIKMQLRERKCWERSGLMLPVTGATYLLLVSSVTNHISRNLKRQFSSSWTGRHVSANTRQTSLQI